MEAQLNKISRRYPGLALTLGGTVAPRRWMVFKGVWGLDWV